MKNHYILTIVIFFFTLQLCAQGGDDAATASGTPVTLPFSANGTTVGRTDTYNNIAVMGDVGFTSGPDWLYYFCATSSTVVTYDLVFTPDATNGVWPSISVWQAGVPGVGSLVAQNAVVGDVETNMTGSFATTSGVCYYVMIDNWPTPNGFPYNLSLTLPPAEPVLPVQPTCTNMGFESGSFTGWSGGWGNTVTTNTPGQPTPIYYSTTFNTSTAQHSITSGAATDALSGIPQVCPGMGSNSIRLGDGAVAGNGGATLAQKFSVTNSNALFTYYYAVVITDAVNQVPYQAYDGSDSVDASGNFVIMPNWNGTGDSVVRHLSEEQPFFKVELFDDAGGPLPCGNYLVVGGEGIPGFTQIGTSTVYYKSWTPVFIDLSPFIGSNVTVKYTVADCSLGAHYCYAYLDAECASMEITGPTEICPNGSGTLTAPIGGTAYSWTDVSAPGTVLGTTQTLSVSPTAAVTTYECVITSVTGCTTPLQYTVNLYPVTTVTSNSQIICNGSSTTLTATGTPSGAGVTYSWAPAGGTGVTTTSLSPAATTTYTVSYTDPNGCSATGTGTVTVNPLPPAPTTAPVVYCQNDVATELTATAAAGNTLNWYGTNATGGSASATGLIPVTTTVGTTTYYVSQTTTATGCEGPRASLVVTVNALPTIGVNSPTICPAATAVLTATGGTTYEWDANPALTANPYTVTPATTTTYTVVGTINGCSNSAVATVTVSNVLAVGVNSPTICDGGTALLTATGATTYSWDTGGSIGVSTANPYSVNPTVTTTYTVTGTTNGCTGTATATVTVNPIPTTTAGSNSPICANTALNLTATTSGSATYSWTGPNAFTSAVQNPTIASATTAASGTYTVTVSENGCSSTSTVVVVVNPIPTTTAGSNTPICVGSALNLTATASAGATYSWTGPNAFTDVVQNPTIPAATTLATGAYTVTVSANGCSSTSTTNVVVNAIPTTTAGSNSPICDGVTLNLTATGSGIAGSTYNWTGPNGFTAATQNPTIPGATTAATGTYTVTVSANGCSSTATANVVVNQTPSTVAASTPVCAGSDLNLTATASGVVGSTYSWTGPSGFTSAVQNPTVTSATILASGTYTVTVAANGCSSTSSVTGTVNAPITPNIQISPNVICQASIAPVLLLSSLDNPAITGSWNPSSVDVNTTGTYTFTPDAGQCALPVSSTVTVNPLPVMVINNPPDICVPYTVDLTAPSVSAGSTPGTSLTYWQNPSCTNPLSSPASVGVGGTYFIQSTVNGCSTVTPVTVVVHPLPIAAFTPTPDEVSNLNPYIVMQNNSIGAVSYWWDFGDDSQSSSLTNPDHYFPDQDSGTYTITLVATSQYGCMDTAFASIVVNEELIFYVPNTFTPDKDDFNETFLPVFTSGFDPYDYTLFIYNRWGELIFESHNADVGWDGTYGPDHIRVQDDTYTWKIVFKLKMTNQNKVVVGHVNVLR